MDEKYKTHIDELVKAIGKKAKKKEIEEEFLKYVDEFKISVFEAKRSIAGKYDVSLGDFNGEAVERKIAELMPGENNVNILARVVFAEKRDITARGEEKTIISGILGDDTGTRPFTIWEVDDLELGVRFLRTVAQGMGAEA